MSTLIEDLLTYSMISTESTFLQPVDLYKVVQSTVDDLDLAIDETNAKIVIEKLPEVMGHAAQLGHLFGNLISNALKFHRPDVAPLISISCQLIEAKNLPTHIHPGQKSDFYYRIDVADNGIGFEEKYLDRIFKVFQRLHAKQQFPGTGIGLAICQRVAVNHGGDISAESSVGKGSTFHVYFPQNPTEVEA